MDEIPGRLRWQCRRGMLELDVILNQFIEQCWHGLDEQSKIDLDALLLCSDQELQKWLCEGTEADHEVINIVNQIRLSGRY